MFFALEMRIILSGNVILHQLSRVSADISGPDHLTKRLPGSILLVYHSEDGISHMAGWWGDRASLGFQGQNLTNVYGDRAVLAAQGRVQGSLVGYCPQGVMVMLISVHTRTPQHRPSVSGSFPERHASRAFHGSGLHSSITEPLFFHRLVFH